MKKEIRVPYSFLEECAEKYCADTLDMHEPSKSRGQVFEWKRRHWVCTSGLSQYLKWLEVELRMVVPEAEYRGPANNPERSGRWYYMGGRLRDRKGNVWVMTWKEVTLIPIQSLEEDVSHVSP